MPDRAALVELLIDPSAEVLPAGLELGEVLTETLRRHPQARELAVQSALRLAVTGGARWVVFPGWTLVADDIPSWLFAASTGRTIALELLRSGDQDAEVTVLCDGRPLVVACQTISTRADAGAHRLVAQLRNGSRRFDGGILWICGEVEILCGGGGGRGRSSVRNETGLRDAELRGPIALNPAHTREQPQPSRDKRAWLSEGGWLLRSANVYPGGWSYWHFRRHRQEVARASRIGAGAWKAGIEAAGNSCPIDGHPGSQIVWIEMTP
jgi:hypothetical protein